MKTTVSHDEKKPRVVEIDIVKGISIFAVILIHATVLFTSNKLAYSLWDISQYAVQAFVFCSSYLFFIKDVNLDYKSFIPYLRKRFSRLTFPYYIYAVLFFTLLLFFEPAKFTTEFIVRSILVIGGIDISWLVLLFLQFTVVFPLIGYLRRKSSLMLWLFGFISISFSVWLMFNRFPYNYKWIMWLPWLVIVFYTIFFIDFLKKTSTLFKTTVVSIVIFFVLLFAQKYLGHSLKMYDNKYPPNLYYLAYGLMFINLLILPARQGVFDKIHLTAPLMYLSKNSYSLFFIHYLLIYIVTKNFEFRKLEWYGFFIVIFIGSIVIQQLINVVMSRFSKKELKS